MMEAHDWDGLRGVHAAARVRLTSILTDARPVIVPRVGVAWLTYRPGALVHLKCPYSACDTRFEMQSGGRGAAGGFGGGTYRTLDGNLSLKLNERYKKAWMAPPEWALDIARHVGLIPLLFGLSLVHFDADHVMLWRWEKR